MQGGTGLHVWVVATALAGSRVAAFTGPAFRTLPSLASAQGQRTKPARPRSVAAAAQRRPGKPAAKRSSTKGRKRPVSWPAGCLCRFGVIGDIQFADCEDGTDFTGYQRRYFRGVLQRVREAVYRWVRMDSVAFAVQLGDAIDGRNKDAGQSAIALSRVLAEFPPNLPRCDLLGNHELYNFARSDLSYSGLQLWGQSMPGASPGNTAGKCSGEACYFKFPADGPEGHWDIFCLDAYDLSTLGYSEDDPRRIRAEKLLALCNPRTQMEGVDWFEGVPIERYRFVPYNGGLGVDQLKWLREELEACTKAGRKAIVFSHIPILEDSTSPKTILWNAEEVLQILRSEDAGCVVGVIAGHDHDGGYAIDPVSGIHHITFLSPLLCSPGSGRSGAATVACYRDYAEVRGHGVFCAESGTNSQGAQFSCIRMERVDPRGWL